MYMIFYISCKSFCRIRYLTIHFYKIKLVDPGIDCENKYFINISEECYHHWKIVKEEMGFKEDEDLLYYLMNLKRKTLSVALEYVVVYNLSKDFCCVF